MVTSDSKPHRPNPRERGRGARIAARTARRHYFAGCLLLRRGYAGAAAALLEAALEESIKALALGLPSDRSTDDLFDRAFPLRGRHEARLDLARDWYAGIVPALGLVLLASAAIEALLRKFGRVDSPGNAGRSIGEAYRLTVEQLAPELGQAFDLRNRGLYVDWVDGRWTDPSTVTSEEVVSLRRVVARYVRAASHVSRSVPPGSRLPTSTGPRNGREASSGGSSGDTSGGSR
jgi:AbiV family abortive infection protein